MGLIIKKDISPAQKEEVSLFYWRIADQIPVLLTHQPLMSV